jgi:hypothetical protein
MQQFNTLDPPWSPQYRPEEVPKNEWNRKWNIYLYPDNQRKSVHPKEK